MNSVSAFTLPFFFILSIPASYSLSFHFCSQCVFQDRTGQQAYMYSLFLLPPGVVSQFVNSSLPFPSSLPLAPFHLLGTFPYNTVGTRAHFFYFLPCQKRKEKNERVMLCLERKVRVFQSSLTRLVYFSVSHTQLFSLILSQWKYILSWNTTTREKPETKWRLSADKEDDGEERHNIKNSDSLVLFINSVCLCVLPPCRVCERTLRPEKAALCWLPNRPNRKQKENQKNPNIFLLSALFSIAHRTHSSSCFEWIHRWIAELFRRSRLIFSPFRWVSKWKKVLLSGKTTTIHHRSPPSEASSSSSLVSSPTSRHCSTTLTAIHRLWSSPMFSTPHHCWSLYCASFISASIKCR